MWQKNIGLGNAKLVLKNSKLKNRRLVPTPAFAYICVCVFVYVFVFFCFGSDRSNSEAKIEGLRVPGLRQRNLKPIIFAFLETTAD